MLRICDTRHKLYWSQNVRTYIWFVLTLTAMCVRSVFKIYLCTVYEHGNSSFLIEALTVNDVNKRETIWSTHIYKPESGACCQPRLPNFTLRRGDKIGGTLRRVPLTPRSQCTYPPKKNIAAALQSLTSVVCVRRSDRPDGHGLIRRKSPTLKTSDRNRTLVVYYLIYIWYSINFSLYT